MDIKRKKEYIKKISEMRQSSVLCYISGDRQNVSTRIAPDIISVFYEHLELMKNTDKVDLLIYTKGGDVLTALRVAELIYEYTDKFSVLIPFRAYSAGTLISLGASEIVMTKMGELSPVDPNVTGVFNPEDPNNPSARIPISVEDLYSFIGISRDIMGIKDEGVLGKILSRLMEYVHPLALGSIHRTHCLIRSIAKKLLSMHMGEVEEDRINEIVDNLTEKLFSHNYMIARKEARDQIKLPVTFCDGELEENIFKFYKDYEEDLQLGKPYVPEENADANGRFSVCCGIIESLHRTDGYYFDGIIHRRMDNSMGNNVNINHQGWKKIWEGEYQ